MKPATLVFLGLAALLPVGLIPRMAASAPDRHPDQTVTDPGGSKEDPRLAGPNGGRVVRTVSPHLEFFVRDDRRVRITFLDDNGGVIAPGNQSLTLVGGDRANPTRLNFVPDGDSLLSDRPLPEGDGVPVILEIVPGPGAPKVRERLKVDLSLCPGCKLPEYACVCGH